MLAFRRLREARDGVAATEFVLIVPFFLIILLGLVEIANYVLVNRRASLAADFAAEYLSRDNDGILTVAEREIVEEIWMMVNPTARSVSGGGPQRGEDKYARAYASVNFTPDDPACLKFGCDYTPIVQWTYLEKDGVHKTKQTQCNNVQVVEDDQALNGNEIPAAMIGRAPIVIVDLVFPYVPLLGQDWIASQEIHVYSLRKTRAGTILQHEPDGSVVTC